MFSNEQMLQLKDRLNRVLPEGISAHYDGLPPMLYYIRVVHEAEPERLFIDTEDEGWVSNLMGAKSDEALRERAIDGLRNHGWVEHI